MPIDKNHPNNFVFPPLTRWKKSQLIKRAEQVLITQHQMLTKNGKNILHHTLQKKRKHIRLNHYPKGDRIDLTTGGQYFYHCHREDTESQEHGHFHCYLRQSAIPKSMKPTPLPDWDKNQDNPMAHLVAISMNRLGQPIRLFTVNRWVTDETWFDAKYLPKLIKKFKMTLTNDDHWPVLDSWVENMLHLFAPQIEWLHLERDKIMAQWVRDNPSENSYEDINLEEISSIDIDLQTHIQSILSAPTAIDRHCDATKINVTPHHVRLPELSFGSYDDKTEINS